MVLDLHCPPPPLLQVIKIACHRSDCGHNFINDLSDFLQLCQFPSPREVGSEFPAASRSLIGFSFLLPTDLLGGGDYSEASSFLFIPALIGLLMQP